jgi:hypothetical protein
LAAERQQFEAKLACFHNEKQHWETHVAETSAQLAGQRTELEAQRAALQQASLDLANQQAQLAAENARLQDEQRRWESQRAEALDQLANQRAEFELERARQQQSANELAAERERFMLEVARWHDAPPPIDAVSRRETELQCGADLELTVETKSAGAADGDPPVELDSSPTPANAQEESIEQYMSRLLERVRGESATSRYQESFEHAPLPKPPPASANDANLEPADKEPPPSAVHAPHSLAPEHCSNLAAMRELANQSARAAINISFRRRWVHAVGSKLVVALLAVIIGSLLLYFSENFRSLTLYGGIACLLIALHCVVQTALLYRRFFTHHHRSDLTAAGSADSDKSHTQPETDGAGRGGPA